MTSADSEETLRVVLVTVPEAEIGRKMASALVEAQLAACVNLVPGVTSIYRWEQKVREDSEVLLVIKTRTSCCADLADRVRELHPYEVPEILELPVAGGSEAYLGWVRRETSA